MPESAVYTQAFIGFMDGFIQIGGWLILFGLALAGVATLAYGRGRAVEQQRIANYLRRKIL